MLNNFENSEEVNYFTKCVIHVFTSTSLITLKMFKYYNALYETNIGKPQNRFLTSQNLYLSAIKFTRQKKKSKNIKYSFLFFFVLTGCKEEPF